MDDSLRLIQYLYDEEKDAEFSRRVTEDEALRQEHEQLRETKDALDRRASPSPDPDVVDDIVDRAAEAAASSGPSTIDHSSDRAAQTPDRQYTRRLQGVGGVLALLLVAAVGWWQMDAVQAPSATTATGGSAAQQTETAAEDDQGQDGVPAWDDREDVVRLHRRIEQIRTRSNADTWDGMPQSVDRAGP